MERRVIILRHTLTRCCRPRTITATDWASALQYMRDRSIFRPPHTPHIHHTDIGHTRIDTVSTVHIITIGVSRYYGMSLSLPWRVVFTKLPPGIPEKSDLASRLGCLLNGEPDFQTF